MDHILFQNKMFDCVFPLNHMRLSHMLFCLFAGYFPSRRLAPWQRLRSEMLFAVVDIQILSCESLLHWETMGRALKISNVSFIAGAASCVHLLECICNHTPCEFLLKNLRTGKPDVEDINVLLPHEMFASVYSQGHSLWSDVMGSEIDADDFWMHELHKDWVQRHPVLTTGGIKRVVPIILHGDDVQAIKY